MGAEYGACMECRAGSWDPGCIGSARSRDEGGVEGGVVCIRNGLPGTPAARWSLPIVLQRIYPCDTNAERL
jgi:hypothetical protein